MRYNETCLDVALRCKKRLPSSYERAILPTVYKQHKTFLPSANFPSGTVEYSVPLRPRPAPFSNSENLPSLVIPTTAGFPYLDRYGHQVEARGTCRGLVLRAADCSGSAAAAVGVAQVVRLAVLRCSHHVIVAPGGSFKKPIIRIVAQTSGLHGREHRLS